MVLKRLSKVLKRKVEAEATEKEPEKYSYWLEEEEAIVGTGTCRAMDLVEGKSTECKVKVTFTGIPSLWDEKGVRMALYDERHKTDSVCNGLHGCIDYFLNFCLLLASLHILSPTSYLYS